MKTTAIIKKSLIAAVFLFTAAPFAYQAALHINYPDAGRKMSQKT
ncbi:MAG: hypothetical protein WGN25_04580 [Candidatus Electrothrix sp. GW3-4]